MSHRRRLTSMAATVRACVKFSPHEPHQETGCCLSHRDGVTRCQPVFAHMFAPFPPLQCLCIRPALAQFETPIDGLPENNGPKQVVVPKVVALAVFKINFPFLHSVWLMPGDKVSSRRWEKKETGCCCPNGLLRLPYVYQLHRANSANSLCGSMHVCVLQPLSRYECAHNATCEPRRGRFPQFFALWLNLAAKCVRLTYKPEVVLTTTIFPPQFQQNCLCTHAMVLLTVPVWAAVVRWMLVMIYLLHTPAVSLQGQGGFWPTTLLHADVYQ